MKRIAVCLAVLGIAAAAVAQERNIDDILAPDSASDEAGDPTAPSGELDALSDYPDPASELDALSQSADDPFQTMKENANRKPVSVTVRALDKLTARFTDIEAPIGEMAKFKSLEILPRYCDKRPPEEFPETTAFLEIFDRDLARARAAASVEARDISGPRRAPAQAEIAPQPEPVSAPPADAQPTDDLSPDADPETAGPAGAQTRADPDRIFSGWMFASSPALNALEHPIYDVWVIDCSTVVVEEDVEAE